MNFWILFLIFALLVAGDKIITVANIYQVNKNFDLKDINQVEKNPFAKYLFDKFGLLWGTLIYLPLSLLTLFIAYYLLKWPFGEQTALYILMMLYALVFMNNIYFLFKYMRLIP